LTHKPDSLIFLPAKSEFLPSSYQVKHFFKKKTLFTIGCVFFLTLGYMVLIVIVVIVRLISPKTTAGPRLKSESVQ